MQRCHGSLGEGRKSKCAQKLLAASSLAWTIEFVPAKIERLNDVMPPKFFYSRGQRFSADAEEGSMSKNPGSVKRRCIPGSVRGGVSRAA